MNSIVRGSLPPSPSLSSPFLSPRCIFIVFLVQSPNKSSVNVQVAHFGKIRKFILSSKRNLDKQPCAFCNIWSPQKTHAIRSQYEDLGPMAAGGRSQAQRTSCCWISINRKVRTLSARKCCCSLI